MRKLFLTGKSIEIIMKRVLNVYIFVNLKSYLFTFFYFWINKLIIDSFILFLGGTPWPP